MPAFDFPTSPSVGDIYQPAGATVLYQWDGVLWKANPSGSVQPLSMKVTTFTPGSYTYVKPANLKFLMVELRGPGGGGTNAPATTASQGSAGGGGGGGGYARKLYKASDLNASEPLVVGVGGIAGTTGAAGTDCTFKGMTAGAGAGGGDISFGAAGTTFGYSLRGSGGGAVGGDVNYNGQDGSQGCRVFPSAGWSLAGHGGSAAMASGGYQNRFTSSQYSYTTPGGVGQGGIGGANYNAQAVALAANGGPGQAVLTEYFTDGPAGSGALGVTEESGTWTPVVSGTTAAGVGTYTSQVGNWYRVGKLVYIEGSVNWSAHTGTGNISVGGLPFPCNAVAPIYPFIGIAPSQLTFTGNPPYGQLFPGTNYFRPYQAVTAASNAPIAMDAAAQLVFSGCYLMA